jgi:2-(3-amino-3-carboxypropyl)histidine synthase
VTDDAQKVIKQRWVSIGQAAKAKAFGVLIGLKPGQLHLDAGLNVKKAIEKTGRQAYLLALREVTPEALLEFPSIDAYVNTACPRISMEAPAKFSKPVITVDELVVVFGEASWENLLKKGLFGN